MSSTRRATISELTRRVERLFHQFNLNNNTHFRIIRVELDSKDNLIFHVDVFQQDVNNIVQLETILDHLFEGEVQLVYRLRRNKRK